MTKTIGHKHFDVKKAAPSSGKRLLYFSDLTGFENLLGLLYERLFILRVRQATLPGFSFRQRQRWYQDRKWQPQPASYRY